MSFVEHSTPGKQVRTVYNLGSGGPANCNLPEIFRASEWREVRVDINPELRPDIVASMVDLTKIPDGIADAVWSSHAIEHLEQHDVSRALCEILRILKPDGFAVITLPDLARVAELITAGHVDEVLYTAPAGDVTPLDILFGHGPSIAKGQTYMAHRTGFTAETLGRAFIDNGFAEAQVKRGRHYDLWAIAYKTKPQENRDDLPRFRGAPPLT